MGLQGERPKRYNAAERGGITRLVRAVRIPWLQPFKYNSNSLYFQEEQGL